ncbi:hypothetical protein FB451DRAFT_1375456 [Mycena latifolia]|nr:hypothetical protein FB451DRAFT_1375456 [Mycena latifolia]
MWSIEWILPKFSTTTTNDTTIGSMPCSMLMMATMEKYFDCTMRIRCGPCGIPRLTPEGQRQDWEVVLHRLEKLKEYGLQTIAWYHLLYPIISSENLDFSQKVACDENFGYGWREWSGWITAFCVFSSDGLWQGPKLDTTRPQSRAPESMSSRSFWSAYTRPLQEKRPHLTFNGTEYPVIDQGKVPSGYAEVDVKVVKDGCNSIVAGFVGMGFSSSRDLSGSSTGKNDTVRPVLAWWIYSKLDVPEKKSRRESRRRQSSESICSSRTPTSPWSIPIYAPPPAPPPPRGRAEPVVFSPPNALTMRIVKIGDQQNRKLPPLGSRRPLLAMKGDGAKVLFELINRSFRNSLAKDAPVS